jgi:ribulose-phosphate 3-epimerase
MLQIAPSILSADFSKLGEAIQLIQKSGADMVHVDIMDGSFVPNISFGPVVVKSIRAYTKLPFDVHLMVSDPDRFIDAFAAAGADGLTVHAEACVHLQRTLALIRKLGLTTGVSLNPATPLCALENILQDVDMVLLMTVNPGFGGQSYIPQMTRKIIQLREIINSQGLDIKIQVDGGISLINVEEITAAGVDIAVAGSAFFESPNPYEFVRTMKKLDI